MISIVGHLEENADDLSSVATYMNATFSKPVSGEKTNLNSRTTIVTEPVEHFLSPYESIKGVISHYCYYIIPNSPFIYFRRYTCVSCEKCKKLNFLECTNTRCGTWQKAKIIKKDTNLIKLKQIVGI